MTETPQRQEMDIFNEATDNILGADPKIVRAVMEQEKQERADGRREHTSRF